MNEGFLYEHYKIQRITTISDQSIQSFNWLIFLSHSLHNTYPCFVLPSPLSYQPFSTLQELRKYKTMKKYPLFKNFPQFCQHPQTCPHRASLLWSCVCVTINRLSSHRGRKTQADNCFPYSFSYMKSKFNKVEVDLHKRSVTNGKPI